MSLRAHCPLAGQVAGLEISLNSGKFEDAGLRGKKYLCFLDLWDTEKGLGQGEKSLSVAQGYL